MEYNLTSLRSGSVNISKLLIVYADSLFIYII